jgi:hypothetical protein
MIEGYFTAEQLVRLVEALAKTENKSLQHVYAKVIDKATNPTFTVSGTNPLQFNIKEVE